MEEVKASYFGMPTILNRNSNEVSLANFTVKRGENKLARDPTVGGGVVDNGALKGGVTRSTRATNNTETGSWSVG